MEPILKGYSWEMGEYTLRVSQAERGKLTLIDARLAYHLTPSPPLPPGGANDYIRLAQQTHELRYIFFFLHENEAYFNNRINNFLVSEGYGYTPDRFIDMKLECRQEVLRRFPEYNPSRGASFITYIHRFITDVLLRYRMEEEPYSFDSLQEYKDARRIMQVYAECGYDEEKTIRRFAELDGCSEKTAAEKLTAARRQRNRLLPAKSNGEGEDGIQEEELIHDSWDYISILWSGMEAEAMDKAFRALSYREQTLLEQRNAICMRCGRVSDMRTQTPFEALAVQFEGSGASGAERAYKRAVENLMLELVRLGALHCVRLKQLSVQREGKKITAAVFAYQVDNGGAWGTIQFDLAADTAEVTYFAKNDPADTWNITDAAIDFVLKADVRKLPKQALIAVDGP